MTTHVEPITHDESEPLVAPELYQPDDLDDADEMIDYDPLEYLPDDDPRRIYPNLIEIEERRGPHVRTSENYQLTADMNSEVRRRVDPNHTLPEVSLQVVEKLDVFNDSPWVQEMVHILDKDGRPVGVCRLTIADARERLDEAIDYRMKYDSISLNKLSLRDDRSNYDVPHRERPKGLGLATYLIAIETAHKRGMRFESQGDEISAGANHVWQILVECGVATVVKPPVPSRYDADGNVIRYAAEYRADPLPEEDAQRVD